MKLSVSSLTCQQSVVEAFKRCHRGKHFSKFYQQDGGENQLTHIEITSLSHYV